MYDKIALYREWCLPNCTKLSWIKLLLWVVWGRSAHSLPWVRPWYSI